MTKIVIQASYSEMAEVSVYALLKGGFSAQKARISYEAANGLPLKKDVDNYPLILEGTISSLPVAIHVYSVTAGYNGSGPNAMARILEAAGFTFDESDILTKKMRSGPAEKVELTYMR